MCKLVNIRTNFDTEVSVADIKKDFIENIIELAKDCTNIIQIILFGSAIENRCTDDSDIDILVVSNLTRSKLYKKKEFTQFLESLHSKDDYIQQYDVICINGLDELYKNKNKIHLYDDVISNGKILYTKEA